MQKMSEIVDDTARQAQLYWLSNPMIPISVAMIIPYDMKINIRKRKDFSRFLTFFFTTEL
jgi:hypothetical protein